MIETTRLLLRTWRDTDLPEFIRVTNTAVVMQYLGGVKEPTMFQGLIDRAKACQAENGFCFWVAERRSDGVLLGFCGIKVGTIGPKVSEIELGWRLREDVWGQGYASEAAAATIDWGWRNLTCERMVASTVDDNTRSWRLMERLGMQRQPSLAFENPDYPVGHPHRPHVLYTITRPAAP